MRVEIATEVFLSADHCVPLAVMLQHFVSGRHEWVIDPRHVELAEAYFAAHLGGMAKICSDIARKSAVRQTAWSGKLDGRPLVTINRAALAEQVEDLSAPAKLVVENHRTDGAFIKAIAHVFDELKIIDAIAKNWLEISHGGGSGEVFSIVWDQAKRFHRIVRITFLLDGDRLFPDDIFKYEEKVSELKEVEIFGHVLARREAENYVPYRVLAVSEKPSSALSKKIDILKRMTPEQRSHFDMKKGFRGKGAASAEIPEKQRHLYAALPESAVVALRGGFGEGLLELFEREAAAGRIQVRDLEQLGPGVCEELRSLLALIMRIV